MGWQLAYSRGDRVEVQLPDGTWVGGNVNFDGTTAFAGLMVRLDMGSNWPVSDAAKIRRA